MHKKDNSTPIKANFIKTANFLEDLKGDIFNSWIRKTEEKTNATRSTDLAFGEAPVRYKIELYRKRLMKELEENTIEQIRTLLNYLEQTDLLKKKDILRCLDVIAREYGGEVVDKN